MSAEDVATAVKSAVADATNATTLAGHMAQCEKDKGEMKADQLRMHNDNQGRFDKIEEQQAKMMKIIWIAAGVAAALSIGGKELAGKFIGG